MDDILKKRAKDVGDSMYNRGYYLTTNLIEDLVKEIERLEKLASERFLKIPSADDADKQMNVATMASNKCDG